MPKLPTFGFSLRGASLIESRKSIANMKTSAIRGYPPMAQPIDFFKALPPRLRKIAASLRSVILQQAPGVDEAIKFGAVCYFQAGMRFGSIGGNFCMIEQKDGELRLSFIHGASLPDPSGLLRGKALAKRFVPIDSVRDARSPHLAELIRSSAAFVQSVSAQLTRARGANVTAASEGWHCERLGAGPKRRS